MLGSGTAAFTGKRRLWFFSPISQPFLKSEGGVDRNEWVPATLPETEGSQDKNWIAFNKAS